MKRSARMAPLLALCLLTLACGREMPREEGKEGTSPHSEIVIVFDLPGDDFASGKDLEMRDAIAAAIIRGGHGKIMRTGSGMGFMDIAVRLESGEEINSVKRILREISPSARYRIER
jgi:hypothetical protein